MSEAGKPVTKVGTYEQWAEGVHHSIRGDDLWKIQAYRLALFVADIGWHDVTKLLGDTRTVKVSNQLYRALGSIGANLSEGYSRSTGKARALYYEHALGSDRESRGWYHNSRFILGEAVLAHRADLLTQIIRLLLTMIPGQRKINRISDDQPEYHTDDSGLTRLLNQPIPYTD